MWGPDAYFSHCADVLVCDIQESLPLLEVAYAQVPTYTRLLSVADLATRSLKTQISIYTFAVTVETNPSPMAPRMVQRSIAPRLAIA